MADIVTRVKVNSAGRLRDDYQDFARAINNLSKYTVEPPRMTDGSPVSILTPLFLREEVFDSTNKKWYKAIGTTSADWAAMT